MIPQRNLALLSNRLARDGGRRIPEATLERDYCLTWFLIGLSRTPLRERLAFKGGRRSSVATSATIGFLRTWTLRSRPKRPST